MAEALSNKLQEAEENSKIHRGKVCRNSPAVLHLFFCVDDCLLFSKAREEEAHNFNNVLQCIWSEN